MATINSAIRVRYAGPTNRLPGGWIASGTHGRVRVPFNHANHIDQDIMVAASAYVMKYGLDCVLSESILEVDPDHFVVGIER